jgi:hypothetical protein
MMRPKFDDPYSHFLDYLIPVIGLCFVGLAVFLKVRQLGGAAGGPAWTIGFYICLLIGGVLLFTSVPKLIKRMKGED